MEQIAPEGVEQKDNPHQGHGPAQSPAGHLQGDENPDGAHRCVKGGFRPHPIVDGLILDDVVTHHDCRSHSQAHIEPGGAVHGGSPPERIVEKDQYIGQQDIEPQKILGIHRDCRAVHVKEDHKDPHSGCGIVPKTGKGASRTGVLLNDLLEFVLIGIFWDFGFGHANHLTSCYQAPWTSMMDVAG